MHISDSTHSQRNSGYEFSRDYYSCNMLDFLWLIFLHLFLVYVLQELRWRLQENAQRIRYVGYLWVKSVEIPYLVYGVLILVDRAPLNQTENQFCSGNVYLHQYFSHGKRHGSILKYRHFFRIQFFCEYTGPTIVFGSKRSSNLFLVDVNKCHIF